MYMPYHCIYSFIPLSKRSSDPLDQEAKIKAIFGIDQPRHGGIQKDGVDDRTF